MSLRPNARTEVRRNRYKVAVDAEEGRRRREDNMVEIRKNKREENLQKKRREGLQANQQFSVPVQSTVEKKVHSKINLSWFVYTDSCLTANLDRITFLFYFLFFLGLTWVLMAE